MTAEPERAFAAGGGDPTGLPPRPRVNLAGLSLAPESAEFLTCNGSPFSDPIKMGQPRVTDPRFRDLSGCFRIAANIQFTMRDAAEGNQRFFAIMSMNPFLNQGSGGLLTDLILPDSATIRGEMIGTSGSTDQVKGNPVSYYAWKMYQHDPAYLRQMTDFAATTRRFRVVGCGLKVNVDVPPTFQQLPGRIEGGHLDELAAVGGLGPQDPIPPLAPGGGVTQQCYGNMAHGFWRLFNQLPYFEDGGGQIRLGPLPMEAPVMTSFFDSAMWPYREVGFVQHPAAIGMTVRGVQRQGFDFIPMRCNLSAADLQSQVNAAPGLGPPSPYTYRIGDAYFHPGVFPTNCNMLIGSIGPNAMWPDQPEHGSTFALAREQVGVPDPSRFPFSHTCGIDGFPPDTLDLSSASAEDFTPGYSLYLRGDGLTPGSTGMLQVVWWLEYVPNSFDTTIVTPSPVDTEFEKLLAVVSDPAAFPFVTKGHSFFRTLAQVAGAVGRVARVVGAGASMFL